MTIFDLLCDRCGIQLVGPASVLGSATSRRGIRFVYHPGDPTHADGSSLVCRSCWATMAAWLGDRSPDPRCSVCATAVDASLFVEHDDRGAWRLCTDHAVEFLNGLRTVEPKLDPATFVLPAFPRHSSDQP